MPNFEEMLRRIEFEGQPTPEAIKKLISYLEMAAADFEAPPSVEVIAIRNKQEP
jgi:hypothetical protein